MSVAEGNGSPSKITGDAVGRPIENCLTHSQFLIWLIVTSRTAEGRDPAAYRRLIVQSGSRWSGPGGKVDKLLYLSYLVLHQPVG